MFRKSIVCFCVILLSNMAYSAPVIRCDDMEIQRIMVQADRIDDFVMEKTFSILLTEECSGHRYVHIPKTSEFFSSIQSMAMMALASGKKITLGVNEGQIVDDSIQIGYMWIEN